MYRQGDVLIIPVKKQDYSKAKKISKNEEPIILAEGESTGHAHKIAAKMMAALYVINGIRMLHLEKPAKLEHEEHAEIDLPAGDYAVALQREYSPAVAPVRVRD